MRNLAIAIVVGSLIMFGVHIGWVIAGTIAGFPIGWSVAGVLFSLMGVFGGLTHLGIIKFNVSTSTAELPKD